MAAENGGVTQTTDPSNRPPGQPQMLYQDEYVWLLFVSAMDLMLTWLVLGLGGVEVNPVADAVHLAWGFSGMIVFKLCLVLLVVLICETIGRRQPQRGRTLARVAVAISAVPMVVSLSQLAWSVL